MIELDEIRHVYKHEVVDYEELDRELALLTKTGLFEPYERIAKIGVVSKAKRASLRIWAMLNDATPVQQVVIDTLVWGVPLDLMATMYKPDKLVKSMIKAGFVFRETLDVHGGYITYDDFSPYILPKHEMSSVEASRELISAILRFASKKVNQKNAKKQD